MCSENANSNWRKININKLVEVKMENNFESIIDMFLFEANTLLEQLDEILLKVEENKQFSVDYINEIFRIMHTIKGSAAMMQFNSIMTISHKIEDLFYYIRENGLNDRFNEPLISLVFKGTDFIKNEITKIQNDSPLTENLSEFEHQITELLDIVSGKKEYVKNGKNEKNENKAVQNKIEPEVVKVNNSEKKYCVKVDFDDGCGMENLRAFMIINHLKDITSNFTYEPEDIETNKETIKDILQDSFRIYFDNEVDMTYGIEAIKDTLNIKNYIIVEKEDVITNNKINIKQESTVVDVKKPEVNQLTEQSNTVKHHKQSLISVNLLKLDMLTNLVGEIVITESMVVSNPEVNKLNLDSFTKATRELRKLTDELQNVVMSLRMVPVSGVFQKMKRIVRDMNKELDKDVELVLVGDDIELDKTIVDGIADPIMHLVRNSMDHGIESTEERISKGKKPKGTITLTAVNTGGEILVSVQDDGKGLDPEYIMEKAKVRNLLQKPESEYSMKEIFSFVMLPGFSTKSAITEFSGRGVGMDVVKKNIDAVGGNVVLESKLGKGTTVTFKIPLTLAIVKGMQVEVNDTQFIIPINNIQQSLNINKKDIVINTDGSEGIMLRNKCYPIIRLHEIYGIESNVMALEEGILVLIENDGKGYGIFADKLLGEQQVVVKPVPVLLNKFNIKSVGISGCSILGDGSINLILDVISIYENILEA
jgi:two-component system chemotaxis sensor kinase CheA